MDKDPEGNYLISARDACAVHKINGTDGSIIWRLNGNRSDFKMADGTKFCFQHHARWLEQDGDVEVISLYDNSAHGTEHGDGSEVHTAPTSSGKILRLNTTAWTADLVGGYFPPDDLRSKSQGSTQVLPGGNVLVGWGSEGAVTEFKSDGTPIFHAYMDSGDLGVGVENYRAFRYNWTGLPTEEPAIVALESNDAITAYVSWNGDTETAAWRFYAVTDQHGSREFLGEVERSSFETSLRVEGADFESVVAESVNSRGRRLTTTGAAKVEPEILPPHAKQVSEDSRPEGQQPLHEKSLWEEYGLLKYTRLSAVIGDDL